MLYLVGIVLAFFLALLILTKKGRNRADVLLGIWMIVIGLHLTTYYGYITHQIFQYPCLLGTNIPIPFLHAPLLYMYVAALTQPRYFTSWRWLVHLALPMLVVLYHFPFYGLSPSDKVAVFQNNGKGFETPMLATGIALYVSGLVYVFVTNRLLQTYRNSVLNQFSNQEKINLDWLRGLFYIMGVMWVLIIWVRDDTVIFSATSVFVIFIGYFGVRQVGVFTNQYPAETEREPEPEDVLETEIPEPASEKRKYAKSGLREGSAINIHQRLTALMQHEKRFTEPDLTLNQLAEQLSVHPNNLSQVINEIEGVNFYEYVNHWRIEAFKELVALPENQKFTLMALAYDCGFNSKSSFNRFFKKATGLSPSEYIRQMDK